MAHPITFFWPAADTQYICSTQNLGGAGNLLINGTAYQTAKNQNLSITQVAFQDVARTVSLTSANNLSAVNFTVTGYLNGALISETRAGPNINTVETTNYFDSVVSISTNGAVNGVSAGTGLFGRTKFVKYNYHSAFPMMTIAVYGTNGFTYSFGFTLDEVNNNAAPAVFLPTAILNTQTVNNFGILTYPVNYACINILAGGNTTTLTSTFLQQGIT